MSQVFIVQLLLIITSLGIVCIAGMMILLRHEERKHRLGKRVRRSRLADRGHRRIARSESPLAS
ncbi:MAG: hypothetical protein ACYTHM_20655 [Planctomycetota bacterium]|jgi:hypothetical protein